eukprot:RCo023581
MQEMASPSSSSSGLAWDVQVEKELQGMQEVFKRLTGLIHWKCTQLQEQDQRLQQEKVRNSELQRNVSRPETDSKVVLDVGGTLFETTVKTLTSEPGSMLEAMFSGRFPVQKESDGTVFLDRDPTHFPVILNYLRDKALGRELRTFGDVDALRGRERLQLLREVAFYGLEGLRELLECPTLVVSQDRLFLQRLNDPVEDPAGGPIGSTAA